MRTKRERSAPHDHQKVERLKFIDEELFWAGKITRRSIEEAFGVSEETAKADLRDYRRGYAPDLTPDPRDNVYRVSIEFEPRLSGPDPESYLDRLTRRPVPVLEIDIVPNVDRRPIDRTILQSIIRAILEVREIEIFYRSPRAEAARLYRIFPHALLHDGFRWSVRCYIRRETGSHWGEMVLDRIEEVSAQTWPAGPALIGGDTEWQSVVEIELMPNPGLDAAARSAIEEQYGMKSGRKLVCVRQCMLTYFLKRYQLEEPTTLKAPHQAPLSLYNRKMAAELMGMRVPLAETDAAAPTLMWRLGELLPELCEQAILERALKHLLLEVTREKC